MNPTHQEPHPAHQMAAPVLEKLPEPWLPEWLTEQMPPGMPDAVRAVMREDIEDVAGNLAVAILFRLIDATSKNGSGPPVFAAVVGDECVIDKNRVEGAGVSRSAVSKRAIAIRRALGLPPLACPGNARPKRAGADTHKNDLVESKQP